MEEEFFILKFQFHLNILAIISIFLTKIARLVNGLCLTNDSQLLKKNETYRHSQQTKPNIFLFVI